MNIEKIHEFYSVQSKFFKKKLEIETAMDELELLRGEANMVLRETIDNGFTAGNLAKVSRAYDKYKFNSGVVQKFAEAAVCLIFKDLDSSEKNRLEMTSMKIDVIYDHFSYNEENIKPRINGPVVLHFIDIKSGKMFTVLVPVSDSTYTNVVNWEEQGDGMYIVYAISHNGDSREICRVFNESKVAEAVSKYIDGEFDEDINTIRFEKYIDLCADITNDNNCKILYKDNFIKSSKFKSMFANDFCPIRSTNTQIEHCIDDRKEYFANDV